MNPLEFDATPSSLLKKTNFLPVKFQEIPGDRFEHSDLR
jgi:hypothetical protein